MVLIWQRTYKCKYAYKPPLGVVLSMGIEVDLVSRGSAVSQGRTTLETSTSHLVCHESHHRRNYLHKVVIRAPMSRPPYSDPTQAHKPMRQTRHRTHSCG